MKKLTWFVLLLATAMILWPNRDSQAAGLGTKLKGKILLQVEAKGEAWYVNPDNEQRYYLGRPADAFKVMRDLGLGISNADFNSFNGYAPKRLAGKILIKVQDSGKAYYVNPTDSKLYYLGQPSDAFNVMRQLGLGISNNDLATIADAADGPAVSVSAKTNTSTSNAAKTTTAGALTKIVDLTNFTLNFNINGLEGIKFNADKSAFVISVDEGTIGTNSKLTDYVFYGKLYKTNTHADMFAPLITDDGKTIFYDKKTADGFFVYKNDKALNTKAGASAIIDSGANYNFNAKTGNICFPIENSSGGTYYYFNNKEFGPYDGLGDDNVKNTGCVISSDGQHFQFMYDTYNQTNDTAQEYLNIDGRVIGPYDVIYDYTFNSKNDYAFIAGSNGQYSLYLNNEKVKDLDQTNQEIYFGDLQFLLDNETVAFTEGVGSLGDDTSYFQVTIGNDTSEKIYGGYNRGVAFSPDNKHSAYVITNLSNAPHANSGDSGYYVVVDGKKSSLFQSLDSFTRLNGNLQFTNDNKFYYLGDGCLYINNQKTKYCGSYQLDTVQADDNVYSYIYNDKYVVFNNKQYGPYGASSLATAIISPDGRNILIQGDLYLDEELSKNIGVCDPKSTVFTPDSNSVVCLSGKTVKKNGTVIYTAPNEANVKLYLSEDGTTIWQFVIRNNALYYQKIPIN